MPVTTEGRQIIEKATGKVKGTAKSAAHAKASARIRNKAYREKKEGRLARRASLQKKGLGCS